MQTSGGMSNIYFAQYVLGDVLLFTQLSNAGSICALVGAVVAIPLMTKLKKETCVYQALC